MSLVSMLSIARSAMLVHQRAMAVTANNVANAQTPGYSRQRLNLASASPFLSPQGPLGRGVSDGGVTRARSEFFDSAYRRDNGLLFSSSTLGDFLGQVEAAVHEPSDFGIAAGMDGFFGAFADLANAPTSGVNRTLVVQGAVTLVNRLHQLDGALTQAGQDALTQMRTDLEQANSILKRIADLNNQVVAARGAAGSAPDLEDMRDAAVDELSRLAAVRVLTRPDGSIGVLAGNALVVDGANVQPLALAAAPGGGFVFTAGGNPMDPQAGSLKTLSDLTTTILPGIRGQLDALVSGLVSEVNAVHRAGYTATGATNTDFFDPAGVTAGSIQVSAAILASPDEIAAGGTAAPGDGSIALAIGGMASAPLAALGGRSARDVYTELAGAVGAAVRDAQQNASTQLALTERADTMRSSVSGVSIDEEMVGLIGQQQAYAAAAHLVKTANDMMEEILRMV